MDEPTRARVPPPAASILRTFYFCAFISVGISTPYLSPYLRDLGLTGHQIASVLSMIPLANLGVPLLWGWIADRTHRHERVLRGVCLGSAVGMLALWRERRFEGVLGAYGLFAVFNVGIGPVVDALTVSSSPEGRGYGRVRMWGSFGFLVAAAAGGVLLTLRGSRPADPLVPLLMAGGLLTAAVVALRLEAPPARPVGRPHVTEIGALFGDRRFRLLLAAGTLHWMNLAPYNGFFGLFLRGRHLPPAVGGAAFVAGVLAEGLALFWFTALRARFRVETLLAISFGGTVVRWLMVSRATSALALVALQTLHGLTFGLFWISGIALLNDCVPRPLRATGQALYLMGIFGVGSLAGYHATGWVLDRWHDVAPAFLGAGLLEVLPFGMMLAAARRAPGPAPRLAHGP